MKIRTKFVSNSSSSSYQCTVCGQEVSGWDMCLSEAEMTECVNGHCFCDEHMLESKGFDEDADEDDEIRYGCAKNHCPVCSLKDFLDCDLLNYALSKLGMSSEELESEISQKFQSYEQFVQTWKADYKSNDDPKPRKKRDEDDEDECVDDE